MQVFNSLKSKLPDVLVKIKVHKLKPDLQVLVDPERQVDLELLVDPERLVDLQGVEVEQQADQLARETGFLRLEVKSDLNFFHEFSIVIGVAPFYACSYCYLAFSTFFYFFNYLIVRLVCIQVVFKPALDLHKYDL